MPADEGHAALMDGGKLAKKAVLPKFIFVCVYLVVSGSLRPHGL